MHHVEYDVVTKSTEVSLTKTIPSSLFTRAQGGVFVIVPKTPTMTNMNCFTGPFLLLLSLAVIMGKGGIVNAFFQSSSKKKISSSSPFMIEAIDIFNTKYPFGRDPPKKNPLLGLGMPANREELDGTIYESKRFTDIPKQQAQETFLELSKVYGEERALTMVKALPICLAFDKKYFQPSYQEWKIIYGEEESKGMVERNPGLLAISPEEAARSDDSTMAFSYLIGYTRPFGSLLLSFLLFLLLTPGIEQVTGIPIRSNFLGGLF